MTLSDAPGGRVIKCSVDSVARLSLYALWARIEAAALARILERI